MNLRELFDFPLEKMPKRKAGTKKGAAAKKTRKTYRAKSVYVPKLTLKRTTFSSTWSFGTATTNDFWRYYTFTAGDVGGFQDFADIFDEYKITGVKVTFRPAYDNVHNVAGVGALAQPQAYAHVVKDNASTVVPASTYTQGNMNTFLENQGVKTYTLNKPFSIYTPLKVSDALLGGGTSTRFISAPWIRTNETGVSHRGFHIFLQQNSFSTGNTNIKLDTFYTFYIKFRNIK